MTPQITIVSAIKSETVPHLRRGILNFHIDPILPHFGRKGLHLPLGTHFTFAGNCIETPTVPRALGGNRSRQDCPRQAARPGVGQALSIAPYSPSRLVRASCRPPTETTTVSPFASSLRSATLCHRVVDMGVSGLLLSGLEAGVGSVAEGGRCRCACTGTSKPLHLLSASKTFGVNPVPWCEPSQNGLAGGAAAGTGRRKSSPFPGSPRWVWYRRSLVCS